MLGVLVVHGAPDAPEENEMKKLTPAQVKVLQTLVNQTPVIETNKWNVTLRRTGCNTNTLCNLYQLGLISATNVWLGGNTSPDLMVTPAGFAALEAVGK
jgi:hypothetical protein